MSPSERQDASVREALRPAGARARWTSRALDRATDLAVATPHAAWGVLIIGLLACVVTLTMWWTSRQALVSAGLVAPTTRVARVEFSVRDRGATEAARKSAGDRALRVYAVLPAVVEDLQVSLANLPRVASESAALDDLTPAWRDAFALDPERFAVAKAVGESRERYDAWLRRVQALVRLLQRTPIVDAPTFQGEVDAINERMELRLDGLDPAKGPTYLAGDERAPALPALAAPDARGASTRSPAPASPAAIAPALRPGGVIVRSGEIINVASPQLGEQTAALAARAGFVGDELALVTTRLTQGPRPTFRFDQNTTGERQRLAREGVAPIDLSFKPGDVLFAAGTRLSDEQITRVVAEDGAFARAMGGGLWSWGDELGALGMGLLVALGLAAYAQTYCPRMIRSTRSLAASAALFAFALGLACWAAATDPRLIATALAAPVVGAAMVIAIAFDRRTALAFASLLALAACVALRQPAAMGAVALAGSAVVAWSLTSLRTRGKLIRAGVASGVAVSVTALIVAALVLPLVEPARSAATDAGLSAANPNVAGPIGAGGAPSSVELAVEVAPSIAWPALTQAAIDAGVAGGVIVVLSLVILGLLPALERVFVFTTGLTLIELRDPRHPLLRELQQRAPGTYNHSLNVANLAEASADAIGADGLLAYVGALYHDVGKMVKPEFFVENQSPGFNRHERLPPSVSLMVIVGHVRDGMELAREHKLAPSLAHFIESHHGTTLVEYFFHRARKQAEAARLNTDKSSAGTLVGGGAAAEFPQETEYRYPGPKPRSREAAVLMVCDAAESATRALTEPSPARIDALVRAIAHKRLMDGQFDESALTLGELNTVVETVARTLAAIYHPRIAYPDGRDAARPLATIAAPGLTPTAPNGAKVLASPDATPTPAGVVVVAPGAGPDFRR
jgi:putative nucleotidyltransferase with HDIG domain